MDMAMNALGKASAERASLRSFVTTVRRATYRTESAPNRGSAFWKAFIDRIAPLRAPVAERLRLAKRHAFVHARQAARRFQILRSARRPLGVAARSLRGAIGYTRPAAVTLIQLSKRGWSNLKGAWTASGYALMRRAQPMLFSNRRFIRVLMRKFVKSDSDFGPSAAGLRAMQFGRDAIDRQAPFVSGFVRRLIEGVLIAQLSGQMAAGNVGNTLLLARIANLSFRPYIRARKRPITLLYFQALFHCRQFHRIAREAPGEELIDSHHLNHIFGVSHLYSGDPERGRYYLERAIAINDGSHPDHRMLGRCYLLLGRQAAAAARFKRSTEFAPSTVMAHQNYAGRYDIQNYKPKSWEMRRSGALLVYDNYGQLAEDFFLLGDFDMSFRCYQQMLDFQKRWKRDHPLPKALARRIAETHPKFDAQKPIRLLPYEWVTQFGHIALLDSYIKMSQIGMYPAANYVLLAPKDKVVNERYLTYWEKFFVIVRDGELVDELFPYQRLLGDNFMAYPGKDGLAEPWTRAAARAHIEWARQGRVPLLRVSAEDEAQGQESLRRLGLPDGAWYVGLHVREGGYYGETTGGISTHRNSQIADYMPAVRAIVEAGGHVIRLGDKSMQPLGPIPGLIDYALSAEKSASMDIFLCSTSRFVIGTTSGLTTACISFGTPMLLVNCISNDWQLWSGETDFIFKRIRNIREKRILPVAEAFSQPVQGYLINSHTMRRRGLEAVANTAEEIEAAVRYKLAIMAGSMHRPADTTEPMRSYRIAMAGNSMMFGAARPVPDFLKAHPELISPPRSTSPKVVDVGIALSA